MVKLLWNLLLCCVILSVIPLFSCKKSCEKQAAQAIRFRELLKQLHNGDADSFRRDMERVHMMTGVDVSDDAVIRDLVCAVAAIRRKKLTMERIASVTGYDPVRLSYGLHWLLRAADNAESDAESSSEYAYTLVEIYEGTNFPNWWPQPTEDNFYTWRELGSYGLMQVFAPFADVDPMTGEKTIDQDRLHSLLEGSNSFEEFVRRGFQKENPTDAEVGATMQEYRNIRSHFWQTYTKGQARTNQAVKFQQLIKYSLGLATVLRGGSCPGSLCGGLVDLVIQTYLLARDLDPQLEPWIRNTGLLNGINNTEGELREYVCGFLRKVQSQFDEYGFLRADNVYEHTNGYVYDSFAMKHLLSLIQPASQLEKVYATVSFVQLAEKAGFPEFPLSLTKEQSKEMAESMMLMVGGSSHPNSTYTARRLAGGLQSYQSVSRLNRLLLNLRNAGQIPAEATEEMYVTKALSLRGRVDSYRALVMMQMQLMYQLEQCGYFILPQRRP